MLSIIVPKPVISNFPGIFSVLTMPNGDCLWMFRSYSYYKEILKPLDLEYTSSAILFFAEQISAEKPSFSYVIIIKLILKFRHEDSLFRKSGTALVIFYFKEKK